MYYNRNLHLSRLMMDPMMGSLAFKGFIFSSCLRLRTSHQSTMKMNRAISLTVAQRPTYLEIVS